MTTAEFNQAADKYAKLYPEEWVKYCPRAYSDLGDRYLCSKAVPVLLFNCSFTVLNNFLNVRKNMDAASNIGIRISEQLKSYLMPTYYISPALLDAVLRSDVPEGVACGSVKLPMPAATFMLPKGLFAHPDDGSINFISYAYVEKGNPTHDAFTDCVLQKRNTMFFLLTASTDQYEPFMYTNWLSPDDLVSYKKVEEMYHSLHSPPQGPFALEQSDKDIDFSASYVNLLFRILLAMQARPELLSKGQFTGKRLKNGREIWTPNIIGKDYVIKRSGPTPEGSGGWNVRMHWRRGHLRQQPYGPEHNLRKTIWVEPMLIGGEPEKEVA